jgi:hypothetical protein
MPVSYSRIFLAHSKQTPDETINDWVERAAVLFRHDVTAGRDDYMARSRAIGGWNAWVKDVPIAEDWAGTPLYISIAVPLEDLERPIVGRATQVLVEGFLAAGKQVLAFCPESAEARIVVAIVNTELDSWTDAGWLVYHKPEQETA